MVSICAWCNKHLRMKQGSGISHGICAECRNTVLLEFLQGISDHS